MELLRIPDLQKIPVPWPIGRKVEISEVKPQKKTPISPAIPLPAFGFVGFFSPRSGGGSPDTDDMTVFKTGVSLAIP